jgi:hypothetical protein
MSSKKPVYVGSMFIETDGGVVEIGMVEWPKRGVLPGGVRDAVTHRRPSVLPSSDQVREALDLAKWCMENECVFEGRVSYSGTLMEDENLERAYAADSPYYDRVFYDHKEKAFFDKENEVHLSEVEVVQAFGTPVVGLGKQNNELN